MRTGVWIDRGTSGNAATGSPQKVRPSGGIVVGRAAVGEPFVRSRGLEDRHLFLEDRAVMEVIWVVVVADVDPEDVRFAPFGAATEATEQPPAREHVGQGIIFGEVQRVPGSQDVDQRTKMD